MKLRNIVSLLAAAALFFALVTAAGAQEKTKKKESLDRVSGTIEMIDKGTKTLTVRRVGANIRRQVVYSDSTTITNQNKPGGTLDQLKDGVRVICLGKLNDKSQLVAARIDIRQ